MLHNNTIFIMSHWTSDDAWTSPGLDESTLTRKEDPWGGKYFFSKILFFKIKLIDNIKKIQKIFLSKFSTFSTIVWYQSHGRKKLKN